MPEKRSPSGQGVLVTLKGEHRHAGAVNALDLHGNAVGLDGIAGLGSRSAALRARQTFCRRVDYRPGLIIDTGDQHK